MEKKTTKLMAVMLVLAMAATLVLFATGSALAQGEEQEQEEEELEVLGEEVPSELQAKVRELRDALADMKDAAQLVRGDMQEFKSTVKELFQHARSLPRNGKWDLFDQVSALRDEYLGTVKEKAQTIRDTAAAMKDATATAREAWEQEDLEGTLSVLDQAIAKAGELKAQLDELHQLIEQIMEDLESLGGEAGADPASLQTWAV